MAKGYSSATALAALLGVTLTAAQQTQATALLDSVEDWIDRYTSRSWGAGTITDELHYTAAGSNWLYLDNQPILTVTSLEGRTHLSTTSTTLTAGSHYEVHDLTRGLLLLSDGTRDSYDYLLATYTLSAAIPASIAYAASLLLAQRLMPNLYPDRIGVKRYSLANGEVEVDFGDPTKATAAFQAEAERVLAQYRRIVFA